MHYLLCDQPTFVRQRRPGVGGQYGTMCIGALIRVVKVAKGCVISSSAGRVVQRGHSCIPLADKVCPVCSHHRNL